MSVLRADATAGDIGSKCRHHVDDQNPRIREQVIPTDAKAVHAFNPERFSVLRHPLGCKRLIQTRTEPKRVGLSIKQIRSDNRL